SFVCGDPVIGPDGTIYFTSCDRKAYAVDGSNGHEKWEFLTAGMVGTPTLSPAGILYFLSNDKLLYTIDARIWTERWERQIPGPGGSTPIVGRNGRVYIGAGNGSLLAIDGRTGRTIWSRGLERDLGGIYSAPAIGREGLIYVGAGYRMLAIQETT